MGRSIRSWLFVLIALSLSTLSSLAQDSPTEEALRAAMVFNFLKFTELPGESGAGLRLCVAVGDAAQVQAMQALAGRQVRGRTLVVSLLAERGDDCQALYVDSRQRWIGALDSHFLARTLTVGGYAGFVRDGGMIEIRPQDGALRFAVNLAEGRRAGVNFSPHFLRLARHVVE